MRRRAVLSMLAAGGWASAGCVRVETQPEKVAIWVENRANQRYAGALECIDTERDEPLVATGEDVRLSRVDT